MLTWILPSTDQALWLHSTQTVTSPVASGSPVHKARVSGKTGDVMLSDKKYFRASIFKAHGRHGNTKLTTHQLIAFWRFGKKKRFEEHGTTCLKSMNPLQSFIDLNFDAWLQRGQGAFLKAKVVTHWCQSLFHKDILLQKESKEFPDFFAGISVSFEPSGPRFLDQATPENCNCVSPPRSSVSSKTGIRPTWDFGKGSTKVWTKYFFDSTSTPKLPGLLLEFGCG